MPNNHSTCPNNGFPFPESKPRGRFPNALVFKAIIHYRDRPEGEESLFIHLFIYLFPGGPLKRKQATSQNLQEGLPPPWDILPHSSLQQLCFTRTVMYETSGEFRSGTKTIKHASIPSQETRRIKPLTISAWPLTTLAKVQPVLQFVFDVVACRQLKTRWKKSQGNKMITRPGRGS